METPLVMGGFAPEAIRLWQQQVAGTGLEIVAAGGMGGSSQRRERALGRGGIVFRDLARIGGQRASWCAATWRSRPPAP